MASPPRIFERIEIFQEESVLPITWRVEAYDRDGNADINIFSGGDARERAIDYAGWRYRHIHKRPAPERDTYDEDEPRGFV